jgi:leucyl aminopeptidase
MKKVVLFALYLVMGLGAFAQHLYEHEYPVITEEDPTIRALLDSVSVDSIEATISHLCSYWNRRCDSRYIYDVQDWLAARYNSLEGIDTVMLHDFKLHKPGFPEETGDNIIAIQWGTKTPEEFVVCGAHYDSWNTDGADPDTIRAPGADDNATGVAGIWETARLLSHYKFDRSIIYANWCAEEIGLKGSKAYADECAEKQMDIVGYFNMDMNGYLEEGTDIHVHLIYVNRDSLLANYFFNFCDIYYPDMPIRQNWMPTGSDSDFSSFNRNGYAALHPFEDVHAYSQFIHTRQDVLGVSVNNLEQSRRFAQLNLGAVAHLAGLNNTSIVEHETPLVTLYPNPTKDVVNIVADDDIQRVTVVNLLGQVVDQSEVQNSNKLTLFTNGYPSGVYLLNIVTKKGTATQRLVVW